MSDFDNDFFGELYSHKDPMYTKHTREVCPWCLGGQLVRLDPCPYCGGDGEIVTTTKTPWLSDVVFPEDGRPKVPKATKPTSEKVIDCLAVLVGIAAGALITGLLLAWLA